ncbi:ABC transporter permease [Haloferax sp. Atlit-10N]|uniref:Peptide ABC transporter permease n=1 Tax=Haloferax prahovense (strain DSM 18310 / JCM 13924 / TL6) TaxID=1227461 RepID=M0GA83_HALPT|nr:MULTISPECIES: ABC transporter permease [Haloferax]ELZ69196.1 peptide ABC transporter permease [Haloferax prahovense DSM 18310]RDZ42274.1 ABC transporter permease [Haloferax sp. Atlit-19N]RDZ42559.1 ABC transporter permease [Haloferax sp. Atlit-16N]RDZ57432.1 ABC transporter permease [Haloferax sp. Atlit-10N]
MSMYNYVFRRVGFMAVTLFFVTLIAFAVTNILPGDVALLILGPNATEQSLEALQTQLGLNRPLYVQYIDWVVGLLQGNMGESLRFGEPVSQLIAERLPRSMMLAVAATLVAVVLSVPLGVYAAVNQNEAPDVSASMFAFVGISMPIFLWGLVFILVFAVWLNLFPTGGYVSPSEDLVGSLTRLVLPAGAMGFALTAYIMRMTRSSMLEVLSEEYINLARAKGMSQRVIVLRHALKNAIIPVITVIAFQFSYAFGGVVVLEEVFFWPGIGRLTLTAIQSRDIPLIQGCILVVALIYMFSNFAADLLYAYFDPRIRYGGDD